jgi:isopenicillin N synthase-like dioxygenase
MAKTAGQMPILVNIGDLLEDWTGGLLKSTVHRVVFPTARSDGAQEGKRGEDEVDESDRYSIAYFCHPLDEVLLEPVPSRIVEEYEKRNGKREGREAITAGEHLMRRLKATYSVK